MTNKHTDPTWKQVFEKIEDIWATKFQFVKQAISNFKVELERME